MANDSNDLKTFCFLSNVNKGDTGVLIGCFNKLFDETFTSGCVKRIYLIKEMASKRDIFYFFGEDYTPDMAMVLEYWILLNRFSLSANFNTLSMNFFCLFIFVILLAIYNIYDASMKLWSFLSLADRIALISGWCEYTSLHLKLFI